ncbi:MAG: protein kinase [Myxococcales bacterium]|nr:protein kinase [Myxococcales bacterium]
MTEQSRFGRYLLDHSLASGGMGEIWAARDELLQRRVAIKLLHPTTGLEDDPRGRFEREARMVARLQHPHVVQVYDYGISEDGTPYIVMELLDGEDLSRILKRTSRMTLGATVPLMTQAAKGLHAAHRAGIIHHDLKPANLFLARQGGETAIKVLDFGIATMRPLDRVTSEGRSSWAGTPSYMSPEQLRDDPVDHRTDLWSLAVVAYEALTGVSPFATSDFSEIVERVVGAQPPPPSQHAPALGPSVDAFFERALAKDPSERFPSALEFAAAFSALDAPPADTSTTILVVDDEPDLEELMRQRFRRQIRAGRYELLFARDGGAALEKLAMRPDVDVVLTDLNMPGMNGLTLLDRLSRAGLALRSIVLSAYSDMSNIRAAMNAGAYDFLTKPLSFEDLEATLRKAVHDARELQLALRSIEENDALRLFVDDAVLDRLLPLLRASSTASTEAIDATVVSIDVYGVRRRLRRGPTPAVFEILNEHFDLIVPIVNAWQGIVVSFVGDAALVVFRGDDHLRRASSACLAVRAAVPEVGDDHERDRSARPGVCIGLDSGPVVAGNLGSHAIRRLHYTVLGEVVSRALALERRAGPGQILLPARVAAQLAPHFECHALEGPPDPELGAVRALARRRSHDQPDHHEPSHDQPDHDQPDHDQPDHDQPDHAASPPSPASDP